MQNSPHSQNERHDTVKKIKMEYTVKSLSLLLLISSSLAQFEEHGYHGYEGYHHIKQPIVHHQILDGHGYQEHGEEVELDYHAHPKYSFDYSVKDPHTGDNKEHWETRDGDKVKGSYTLTETDGTKRVVEYEADDKNGFNAVVHKIGTPSHTEHKEIPVHEVKKPVYEHIHHEPIHHHEPETISYHHDFQNFDGYEGGFVPIAGYSH